MEALPATKTKNIMEKEILVKMNDEALDLIKNIFNPKEYSKYQREANAMEAVAKC